MVNVPGVQPTVSMVVAVVVDTVVVAVAVDVIKKKKNFPSRS